MDYVNFGEIPTFPDSKPDKKQAVKVLEEAAEAFSAWDILTKWRESEMFSEDYKSAVDVPNIEKLLDECCDVVQAVSNLVYAFGYTDMRPFMEKTIEKNTLRGRYDEH